MEYAEQNVAATFDFAQKLMHAKDATEVMGLQSEFLGRQMQAMSTQVRDLGQSADQDRGGCGQAQDLKSKT